MYGRRGKGSNGTRLTPLRRPASFHLVKTPLVIALCAALALSLSACTGDDAAPESAPARTPPVLTGVPVIEGSQVVDTVGTSEAARMTLDIPMPPESVAAFYRRRLTADGWRLQGDVPDAGGVDLYAERNGPPLWVHIRPGRIPGTTQYALIGALASAPPGGDTVR